MSIYESIKKYISIQHSFKENISGSNPLDVDSNGVNTNSDHKDALVPKSKEY